MEHINTFFAQGMLSARSQASKYTPEVVKVTSLDGTTVTSHFPTACKILYNIIDYPEIPEISYDDTNNIGYKMMKIMVKMRYLLWKNDVFVDKFHHVQLSAVNVAGEKDVAHHLLYLRKTIAEKKDDTKLVVFGCSRGASVTLISVSLLTEEEQGRIALVIVEAPFDTVESVIRRRLWIPWILLKTLETAGSYSPDQLSPKEAVHTFPLTVPIAFITTKVDNIVPLACTQLLISSLVQRGHPNLHHLELETAPHAFMPINNEKDSSMYTEFVDGLYEKYCA